QDEECQGLNYLLVSRFQSQPRSSGCWRIRCASYRRSGAKPEYFRSNARSKLLRPPQDFDTAQGVRREALQEFGRPLSAVFLFWSLEGYDRLRRHDAKGAPPAFEQGIEDIRDAWPPSFHRESAQSLLRCIRRCSSARRP